MFKLRYIGLTLLLLTVPVLVSAANDGGVTKAPVNTDNPIGVVVDIAADPNAFAEQVFQAVADGNWTMLAGLVLIFIVFAIRKWGGKIPKLGTLIQTDLGGAVTGVLTGLVGFIGLALVAGKAITLKVILTGLKVGFLAIGGFTVFKKILNSRTTKESAKIDISEDLH